MELVIPLVASVSPSSVCPLTVKGKKIQLKELKNQVWQKRHHYL